jgi:hypothetical protein
MDQSLQESVNYNYDIRFLDESALQSITNLQELIAQDLPSPDIFRLHDKDYFKNLLKLDRYVIGVFVDGCLIAYSPITAPEKGRILE